ncbi:serine protease [Micromonospora ureilytica]|uniref:trypsin-like peptidase domain-containing protein n=1 Tax=Micromonospora ureilytica TaxID=709868 RepID=UPI002E1154FF|nr:serine protease [Micromonospora ureilytica]
MQSLFLIATSNGQELGTGTGFVVQHQGQPYLITNYHVAAGRNPHNGQPRHSSGAVPDALSVHQMLPPEPNRISWQPRTEPVLDLATDRALWLEHPTYGRKVDVVALPLKNVDGVVLNPYDAKEDRFMLKIGPSDGVSIVGFPYGKAGGGLFGIWTRGFMASEPLVDWNDLPCFLIDARTRPGQSGSPVIAYQANGVSSFADGSMEISGRVVVNLLGVYSGRINEQSDLGVVWKVRVINEILEAQKPGVVGL